MKNTSAYFILIVAFYFFSCNSNSEDASSDLNLYFETSIAIDSIFVSNITQDREFQFLSYENPLHVDLNDSINDLYNINFYTEKGLIMNQMWLNGENLVIKGLVSDKGVEIDTVIGSDLYYRYMDFRSTYSDLLRKDSQDTTKINHFLIEELKDNLKSPLSIDIAEKFRLRNLNNKGELRKVFELLSTQDDMFKNHLLNPYAKIEHLLSVDQFDFSEYAVYDREKQLSPIEFPKNNRYLIDFWFVNCLPCAKEHKIIKDKLEWLDIENVGLIGISTDTDHEKWNDYLKQKEYRWKNYREQEDDDKKLATNLLINVYPTYLLIDEKGNILRRSNSFSEIEAFIAQ